MEYEHFLAIYHRGPEELFKFLSTTVSLNKHLFEKLTLQEQLIKQQAEQISLMETQLKDLPALKERINELEAQKKKNSRNSSKPPSSDDFNKPKSLRKKSDKPSGGQKGHKGHTLKMVENPDHIVTHQLNDCINCSHSLKNVTATAVEKRQVFDFPDPRLEATEHRSESKCCPICETLNKAPFPADVPLPVQYGNNVKTLVTYLHQYQLIPYERTCELFYDLFNHELSEGTLFNFNNLLYEALETTEDSIKEMLTNAPVVHLDETGMRVEGKRQWFHVTSTDNLTFYAYHQKRGSDATDEIGILPNYTGIAVHDFWSSYFKYDCGHSLCNAHHLRELTGIFEHTGQTWCQEMIDLLLEIKSVVDEKKTYTDRLTSQEITGFENRYDKILEAGFLLNPPPVKEEGKRGRPKQSKAKNLLDRLRDYRKEVLAFMYMFSVPFENNLAERDLRMIKVKQKISGVFRSAHGANMFCRIRGYISTARKNAEPVFKAIKSAIEGMPFTPAV